MAIDMSALERDADIPDGPRRRPNRRRKWVIGAVSFAVVATAFGYVTGNEVQANAQFDQTHRSLDVTRHHIEVVLAHLATVRHDLNLVNAQVVVDTTMLAQDTTQLQGMQSALVNAQADVSHQTSAIGDLQACLGGVEQALNALAVNDQNRAISALNAVSPSCTNAVASNG
jgi:hypothetical protein